MSLLLEHIKYNTQLLEESKNRSYSSSLDKLIHKLVSNPTYASSIKSNFPKLYRKYGVPFSSTNKVILKSIFGPEYTITSLKSKTSDFDSIISSKSQVQPLIYSFKDTHVNAFTIPGVYSEMDLSLLTNYSKFMFRPIPIITNTSGILGSSIGKIHPLVFTTTGFNRSITNNDMYNAVILHELGHWRSKTNTSLNVQVYSGILGSMMWVLSILTAGLAFPALVIVMLLILITIPVFSRRAEFDADLFAKEFGYGQELANALRKLEGLNLVKSKAELKELSSIADKVSILTDTFKSHPSTYRRIQRLLNESNDQSIDTSLPIASKLDDLIDKAGFIPELAMFSR